MCELAHSFFHFFLIETSSADFDATRYRSFLKEKGILGEGCWLREGLTPSDEVQSHRYGNRSFSFLEKIKNTCTVKQFKLVSSLFFQCIENLHCFDQFQTMYNFLHVNVYHYNIYTFTDYYENSPVYDSYKTKLMCNIFRSIPRFRKSVRPASGILRPG